MTPVIKGKKDYYISYYSSVLGCVPTSFENLYFSLNYQNSDLDVQMNTDLKFGKIIYLIGHL